MSPKHNLSAEKILGNPDYQAISYGGYRQTSRDVQPTIEQLKEDIKIMHAIGVRILRTYNTSLAQAANLLKAIDEIKQTDPTFEFYVMLGAWINCEHAWTSQPNHDAEDRQSNEAEIARAVELAKQYPDIVKIIAVGNESMVKWAASYFVQPGIVLGWVNYLQQLKEDGELPNSLWITSSDNFASWGGGDPEYHVDDLIELIKAVDYVSLHTYPMHDTHYNPQFWGVSVEESSKPKEEQIEVVMQRALEYAQNQYSQVKNYVHQIDPKKPIHIGETGWASASNGFYGNNGSKATDEYKEALYYQKIREWTNRERISCFYFEAFDEQWKDAQNPGGSENHFGIINLKAQAKYALWNMVEKGAFEGLTRDGLPITKSYNGQLDSLLKQVEMPPLNQSIVPVP